MGFQDIKDSITWASTHGGENAALAYLTQYFPRASDSGPGHGAKLPDEGMERTPGPGSSSPVEATRGRASAWTVRSSRS